MRDGQRLAGQPENDLLVRHEPRKPHAVHGDSALFPAARTGEGLLLRLAMCEWLVLAAGGEAAGGRQGSARRRVQLAGVMQLDHLDGVEVRGGELGEVHHQDRPDREVGRHDPAHTLRLARRLQLVDIGA